MRSEFYECSFSAERYYLAQTMPTSQDNAAVMDSLFSTYHVFNKFCFDYFKANFTQNTNETCSYVNGLRYHILLDLMSKYHINY